MKLYLVIFLILTANAVFSQTGDTIRTQVQNPDTTSKPVTPFDTNKIPNAYRMSDNSVIYGQSNWLWNDKRNLGEILNERPGFMVNFFNDGGRNTINYNKYNEKNIGILKDGIQINDILFGGFDIENLSVNEIDTIEEISTIHSYLYGINSQNKTVNIITKDVFQPELFSQLRFTQDRYGSEYADVYFSQSISRKINWQIGATKNSLNGFYTNSEFDVWRARSRVNFFISPKLNIRLNLNYANIKRGLNEGLKLSTEDTLRNPELAVVYNPDSYEKLTNFFYNISINGRFLKNRSSLTKLQIYSQNSLREYRDEERAGNSNGILKNKNFHTIQYGLDFKQNFEFKINKDIKTNLLLGTNAYLNLFTFDNPNGNNQNHFTENYYSFITRITGSYKVFSLTLSGKYDNLFETNLFQYGIEADYLIYDRNNISLTAFGGINLTNRGIDYLSLLFYKPDLINIPRYNPLDDTNERYTEAGIKLKLPNLYFKFYQYGHSPEDEFRLLDGNYEAGLTTDYFDVITALNFNESPLPNQPRFFFKTDVSYHNYFFNNNLNLRIGVNLKYINDLYVQEYDQLYYYRINRISPPSLEGGYIDHLFNMDAYIGARIGSANIAFVFANIFDNFNYDTFLYPWNDRSGALNALSRFTITWDFFN